MPSRIWFCGHCKTGPMTVGLDDHCCTCGRPIDAYSIVEYLEEEPYETSAFPSIAAPPASQSPKPYQCPQSSTYCCCQCGDGPKLIALQPACVNCHHLRCYYCKVEWIQVQTLNLQITRDISKLKILYSIRQNIDRIPPTVLLSRIRIDLPSKHSIHTNVDIPHHSLPVFRSQRSLGGALPDFWIV